MLRHKLQIGFSSPARPMLAASVPLVIHERRFGNNLPMGRLLPVSD